MSVIVCALNNFSCQAFLFFTLLVYHWKIAGIVHENQWFTDYFVKHCDFWHLDLTVCCVLKARNTSSLTTTAKQWRTVVQMDTESDFSKLIRAVWTQIDCFNVFRNTNKKKDTDNKAGRRWWHSTAILQDVFSCYEAKHKWNVWLVLLFQICKPVFLLCSRGSGQWADHPGDHP